MADTVPAHGHIAGALLYKGVAATVLSVARSIASIEQEIRTLSPSDKEGLLRVLLEELDGPPDAGAESAWLEEMQRRSDEIDSGTVKCVPADEVLKSIDSTLKK